MTVARKLGSVRDALLFFFFAEPEPIRQELGPVACRFYSLGWDFVQGSRASVGVERG